MTIRRASVTDRAEILPMLTRSFSWPEGPAIDFARHYPHLLHDRRMRDHFVRIEDGRVVGVIGLYPFRVLVDNVEFRAAGVGQVSCLPEYRQRGVMKSILERVCQEIQREAMDFVWLWGDRRRYGRYGWALGGDTLRLTLTRRYAPPADAALPIRELESGRDAPAVLAALKRSGSTVVISRREWLRLLQSPYSRGLFLNRSFVLYNSYLRALCWGAGRHDELVQLIAHAIERFGEKSGADGTLTVDCSRRPSNFLQACQTLYAAASTVALPSFRVGALAPFLEKACRAAQPRVPPGSGTLAFLNTNTGETATLRCRRGRIDVSADSHGRAYRLTTQELSEVCFGLMPPDLLLPGLPPDSPFRAVLPLPAHISIFFGV